MLYCAAFIPQWQQLGFHFTKGERRLYYTRQQVRLEACRLTLTRFTDDLTCPEFVLYGFFY